MKKVAILQSNYIPWKGYFDIIHDVDLFIWYDDVQYTIRDWRNRNKIKTHRGAKWLTVPTGNNVNRLINQVKLEDHKWASKHWKSIQHSYAKAPYFHQYKDFLQHIYMERHWDWLSQLNQYVIEYISKEFLGLTTVFQSSCNFACSGKKEERLLSLLREAGATDYYSGPAARNYINESNFQQSGISIIWKDYSGYIEYPQLYPPFIHEVSILDLLLNVGSDTPYFIWGWRE